MAISRFALVKFLEFALAAACLGLHYHSFVDKQTSLMLASATFGGYLIITAGVFAGLLVGTPINRRIDIYFCLLGCALFIASGSLAIEFFQNQGKSELRNYGLAKAALAIINGIIFLVDAVFVYRGD
ncbi:hypothetical protein ONE63_007918 [Megalurothrips usitatus]|uniref:DUF7775 domain-containing protein n=1 Tax=Megalurothrips usitatus TaxID=439358 RepID=A0AAV7XQ97_9NEOP|nr:hypothetical protein ONE63_007918 [Megalurothrips usitatus]